jgi:hypothetical protein
VLRQPGWSTLPSVFFSYSHADEALRDQLEKQLAMLKNQGVIETWHDRRIPAGDEIDAAIDEHINSDEIILLLISADFIASHYCFNREMARAMERHEAGEAQVIPVILRACDWEHPPLNKLKAVPLDGKPIVEWPHIDRAMLEVAQAVREAATKFTKAPAAPASFGRPTAPGAGPAINGPRSSNLGLAKTFTQRDRDQFRTETFEFIARFFENSLSELGQRNEGIEGVFRRVDANRFFATIYRNGKDVARATIFMGGDGFSRGINYVNGDTTQSNSLNESLSVDADDQSLYLTSMGMASFGSRDQKLSQEGAAELLWSQLIAPLQYDQGRRW